MLVIRLECHIDSIYKFYFSLTFFIIIIVTLIPTFTSQINANTPNIHFTYTHTSQYLLYTELIYNLKPIILHHLHSYHFITIDNKTQPAFITSPTFFSCNTLVHIYKTWHRRLIKKHIKRNNYDCWYNFKRTIVEFLRTDTSYPRFRYVIIHLIANHNTKYRNIYQYWHKQLLSIILSIPQWGSSICVGSCYATGITYLITNYLIQILAELFRMAMSSYKLYLHTYMLYDTYAAYYYACLQRKLLLKCCLIVCCQCKIHIISYHNKIHRSSCVDNNNILS